MPKGPTVSTTFNAVDKVSAPMKKMHRAVKVFAGAAVATFATGALARGMKSFITEASKIEDAVAGFTPLLGGAAKAQELVDKLNKTAASTPFQFDNISAAAKQLLPVMNGDIEKTVDTFRMLGDTAGGNAQKLDSITRGFTKSMLKGKVDMESLNMIAEAGVPIYSELSASMGVSVKEMMEMSSAGKISSKDLEAAFAMMTSEGGIFFNGMEIASKTLSGKLSTLSDNIKLTKAAIGESLLPTLKPIIDKMISLAGKVREWAEANKELINSKINVFIQKVKDIIEKIVPPMKKIGKALSGLFAAIWSIVKVLTKGLIPGGKKLEKQFLIITSLFCFLVKVATYVVKALKPIVFILKPLAIGIGVLVVAIKIWTIAQAIINVVIAACPIVLIISAIAVLITAIVLMVKHWDKVKEVLKAVWDWIKKTYDSFKGLIMILGGPLIAPLVLIIEVVRSVVRNFKDIKAAFTDKGFIAGIMAIGKAIFEGIISPFKSAIELIGKAKKLFNKDKPLLNTNDPNNPGNDYKGIVSRNQGIIESQSTTTNKWQGELSIAGAPPDSVFTQKGKAIDVMMNTGHGGAQLQ